MASSQSKDEKAKAALAESAIPGGPEPHTIDADSVELDDLLNVGAMELGGMDPVVTESIPGGAFLNSDGKGWHDAEGRPLMPENVKLAKAHAAKQKAAHAKIQETIDDGQRMRFGFPPAGLKQ
jgi:hypothetical protein